jgi:lathosterol oxidase
MDDVLFATDRFLLEPYFYSFIDSPLVKEPTLARNIFGVWFIMSFGGILMYISFAALSYLFIFDKAAEKDPLFLKNQVAKEIGLSLASIPFMGALTTPILLGEIYGYSKCYDNVEEYGLPFLLLSIATFLLFTDFGIYWIHRGLHSKYLYFWCHKPHHWWKIPTPFASHAFHPVDGWAQSLPYHLYVFLFPMHKWTYLALFVFVNFWTISIHDGDYRVPSLVRPFINGAAHHTEHHLLFNYNYGQFFTLWDRIGGSYKTPLCHESAEKQEEARKKKASRKQKKSE